MAAPATMPIPSPAHRVQAHGVVLVVSPTDFRVVQVAGRSAPLLGLDARGLVGRSLRHLGASEELLDLVSSARLRNRRSVVRVGSWDVMATANTTDHQGILLEFEPVPTRRLTAPEAASRLTRELVDAPDVETLCARAAALFRRVSRYDRVMVLRTDPAEISVLASYGAIAGQRPVEPSPTLLRAALDDAAPEGQPDPRVRAIPDTALSTHGFWPEQSPLNGRPIDLSRCAARAVSEGYRSSLEEAGIRSSLLAKIVIGGRVWAVLLCHGRTPQAVNSELNAVAEILAEVIALKISSLQASGMARAEVRLRGVERSLVDGVAETGDWLSPLREDPQQVLGPIDADRAAVLFDGCWNRLGAGHTESLFAIRSWLAERKPNARVAWADARSAPPEALRNALPEGTSILAVRISRAEEWLVWFRDACSESVARPWSIADRAFARATGDSLSDIVTQVRSVRYLIAQDQLASVANHLSSSWEPVVLADAAGRIIQANPGFNDLFGRGGWVGRPIEELAARFEDPDRFLQLAQATLKDESTPLVDLRLRGQRGGSPLELTVRADVVAQRNGRVLGYAFYLTELPSMPFPTAEAWDGLTALDHPWASGPAGQASVLARLLGDAHARLGHEGLRPRGHSPTEA